MPGSKESLIEKSVGFKSEFERARDHLRQRTSPGQRKCFSIQARLCSLGKLRRVCTAEVGTTGIKWFSRYEATNYCILYVYVPDLYPTRSGGVWILEVDNLEINGGTGPRAVLCLARYGRCHVCLLSNH